METDAVKAFRYITGPLSPDAEQAVTRAKNMAQRALPQQPADRRAEQSPSDGTKVALTVDPTTNMVIARVIDRDTGQLIRQLPSQAAVQFVAASRAMLGEEVDAKYKEARAQADADPEHPSQTLVTV
ncbi:MAG TPA: flagellar protein FlaG [Alphaproteobacteria bacterium]